MLDEKGELSGPRFAPGTEVAGFIIEETIASGSFGTVYRARRSGRPYAIKLVRIDPRGDREAAALRLMRHPNVVSFHGYGLWPEDAPHWLVLALELVEGLTLDAWAARENPSALELVTRVLLPFALTLADVHDAGVVHRDIKEANIIVREADGQPVLVDFGAAGLKEGAPRLTLRLPPGTAEYRSPEALRFARQWEGEPYPFAPGDDLWAMGVVTYALMTRTLPFGDRSNLGLNRAILETTPPAPHVLNPRVPLALSELCMRMLDKEPEARYPDARALAEDLAEQCTQADKSWRVRLFPEARQDQRPDPTPAEPRRQFPARWWVAGLVLAVVLGGAGAFSLLAPWQQPPSKEMPPGQREQSPPPKPPQQVIPRQELAPGQLTGEVGNGATPEQSSTPAPAASATNREEPSMTKSKTTRALLAAGCVAGSACVSGPQHRQPPKPADCPPGADATIKRFNILPLTMKRIIIHPFDTDYPDALVSEGPVTGEILPPWGDLPGHTHIYGELFFGKSHVYGRFTRVRLPDGEMAPICLEMSTSKGLGIAMEPGSTSEKARVSNIMSVEHVLHFQ
ncbi:serine/threonine-protein kinase [Archangium gephyra]|uniref:Serine/threonine-protein kinase n=1 Tax=Archangium gephyra TaxID=48 RepID=A0AAC8TDR9_9BACT|nr:serine/threonine protein kinase [Archangium gephyra]AKJ02127.1 serine/threonine protein kinase [Archangium gephyra]REG28942.1 serine/threonine-protein kinase [Archangium gephyra]